MRFRQTFLAQSLIVIGASAVFMAACSASEGDSLTALGTPGDAGADAVGSGGSAEPGTTGTGGTSSGGTDPGTTGTGGTDPGVTGSGGTDPGGTDPGGTDPGGTDPVAPPPVSLDNLQLIGADDANIRYFGRFDHSDPAAPEFDWPGVYIKTNFEGSSLGLAFSGNAVHFDVFIDGTKVPTVDGSPQATFMTDGSGTYFITDSLSAGTHTLKIAKRSESQFTSASAFQGLYVDPGTSLSPPDVGTLNIEFIGDSYTVAIGNTSGGGPNEDSALQIAAAGWNPATYTAANCPWDGVAYPEGCPRQCSNDEIYAFTNTHKGYGPLAAQQLGAEYAVNSIAGLGCVRNYSGSTATDGVPDYWAYTLMNDDSLRWDFSQWVPDVVVNAFGINDFSTPLGDAEDGDPSEEYASQAELVSAFKARYLEHLAAVRAAYPGVKQVLLATNLWDSVAQQPSHIMEDTVRQIIAEDGGGDLSYFFFYNESGLGCQWHPDIATHAQHGPLLAAHIQGIL